MRQTTDDFHEEQAVKLLLKHYGFVFRQARRFLPAPGLAEDVVQQVFVEFLKKAESFDVESDIRPLLMVITRRVAQKVWRQQAKMLPESLYRIAEILRDELEDRQYDSLFDSLQEEKRIGALRHCLSRLSDSGRELIKHYYFEGISTEELAENLHKKANTVAKAIHRIREKLKDCIERTLRNETADV